MKSVSEDFDREKYDLFVEQSPQGSLFAKSWWLDMWSSDWQLVSVENPSSGEIMCAIPILLTKNRIGEISLQTPPLTRYLGIMFRNSTGRPIKIYSEQAKLTGELIEKLPEHSVFSMMFHYRYDFWLPLRDEGYNQETYYTYILDTNVSEEEIVMGYRENIRREIRKAEKVNVIKEIDVKAFADIYIETFRKQGITPPVSREKLYEIDAIIEKNTGRYITGAFEDDKLSAVIYVLDDKTEHRYLMGGKNPEIGASGAPAMLLDYAVKRAKLQSKNFNFEGSMKESIVRFFRSFGGQLLPYSRIYKDNRILKRFRASI